MRPRIVWLIALCCSLLFVLTSSASAAASELLSGRAPTRAQGVSAASALTDGVRAAEGDDWSSDAAAKLESERAFVEYDLGAVTTISAAYLQGDNNDEYLLSVSTDGQSFKPLWTAPAVSEQGLRQRSASALSASGRYVRLSARGGDGSFAVAELQLFESVPAVFPPQPREKNSGARGARVRDRLLAFVFAVGFLLFASTRKARSALLPVALPALVSALLLAQAIGAAWPLEARELSMLRAAMAGIAGLALLRELFLRKLLPAHPTAVFGTLAVAGVLAFGSFYNLGAPQFWNEKTERPEFVHTWDMRIYYPFAKYHEELGYDGVYLASAGAYLEDVPGTSLEKIGQYEIRDLDTLRLQRLGEKGPAIAAVKARFSPERWQSFKRDMTYFREVMGKSYLRTLNDHGANATPVWIVCARLLFGWAPASGGMLFFGGLIDALLLLALFVTIGRTFGWKVMLVALVIFGANDFYMFGTNWGGATLRHDWLAYLGFGVCALASRRFGLAGGLFALSAMIRAFPLMALVGVALPALCWVGERRFVNGRWPTWTELRAEHQPTIRVLLGAAATALGLFLLTSLLLGFSAWTEWWSKIVDLNSGIGVNDVSLKALIASGEEARRRTPVYVASVVLCVAVVVAACRYRKLEHAALLALPLIAVLGNPSSYYLHFIFLLPLLGGERRSSRELTLTEVSLPLLAICVAQYWTALDPDPVRHFQAAVALLFAGLAWLYVVVLKKSLRTWPELRTSRSS
jgi:hypothetical protein